MSDLQAMASIAECDVLFGENMEDAEARRARGQLPGGETISEWRHTTLASLVAAI